MSDAGKSDVSTQDVSTHNAPHAWKAPLAQRRHDLRTPLNAVIGYSEILLEELADSGADDSDLAPIEQLRSDGRALLELVGSALDGSSAKMATRRAKWKTPTPRWPPTLVPSRNAPPGAASNSFANRRCRGIFWPRVPMIWRKFPP